MKVIFVKLQSDGVTTLIAENALYVLDFSGSKKGALNLVFEQEGVSAEIVGLYAVREKEHFDFETIATHKAPNTSCVTYVRGVLFDSGSSNYIGKILIDKRAQQTSSFLENNVLVVGNATHNNSQPILQIEADDVKASHGATTGRIDPSQVYYLQSRGLNAKESEELIVQGFFESLLAKISDEKIKSAVAANLGIQHA